MCFVAEWHGRALAWHGMAWHGMAWHGMASGCEGALSRGPAGHAAVLPPACAEADEPGAYGKGPGQLRLATEGGWGWLRSLTWSF